MIKDIIKKLLVTSVVVLLTLISLVGCASNESNESSSTSDKKDIKVGVCAGPYGDMFKEAIQPSLEELGYNIEIIEFSDYIQPNNALAEKDVDVNMFQHSIYLNKFSEEHNLELSAIIEIPTAAMGVFSDEYDSIDEVEDGSLVAIPNDDTNLARSLRVLEQTGIITIDPEVDSSKATVNDILQNPKNLEFKEVSAEILPSVLDSTGLAVINGNYAMAAGLKLSDAIHNEVLAEGYFNVIAVRSEDVDSILAEDLVSIVDSQEFRDVIEDESKQYVAFGRPVGYEK